MLAMTRVERNCLGCALPSSDIVCKSEHILWTLDNKFIENESDMIQVVSKPANRIAC